MQKKIKDRLFNTLIMCILKVIKLKNNTSPFGCTRLSFMSTKITKTGITSNKISGRGLPLFLRYAEQVGLYGLITGNISSQISGNRQGFSLLLKQVNVQLDVVEAESESQLNQLIEETRPGIVLLDPTIVGDIHQFVFERPKNKFPVIAGICENDDKKTLIEKLQKLNGIQSSELSDREIAILKKVALGYTNKEISDQLHISPHTVITHRKNITAKLGIKTISGLTVYALINNLFSTEDVNLGYHLLLLQFFYFFFGQSC